MGRAIEGREVFPEDEHRERFLGSVGKDLKSGDLVVHARCLTKCVARVAKGEGLSAETVLRVRRIGWRWEEETRSRV